MVGVKTRQQIVLYFSKHVSMGVFTKNLNPEDSPTIIDIPELVQLLVIMVKLETVLHFISDVFTSITLIKDVINLYINWFLPQVYIELFPGKKAIIITSKHGTTIFFSHYNLFLGKPKEKWA